jgi:hypothetical protein
MIIKLIFSTCFYKVFTNLLAKSLHQILAVLLSRLPASTARQARRAAPQINYSGAFL